MSGRRIALKVSLKWEVFIVHASINTCLLFDINLIFINQIGSAKSFPEFVELARHEEKHRVRSLFVKPECSVSISYPAGFTSFYKYVLNMMNQVVYLNTFSRSSYAGDLRITV